MKQVSAILLSFLLMASSVPRPPQLLEVFPAENSVQTSVQFVGAALNFRLGEEAERGSVQLFFDGIDVTKQARIGGTRDWPQSYYKISYTPNSWKLGIHCAEIRFRTIDGTTKSYSWSFSIKSP
ncbi:MAG: hypothetical protein KME60_09320 [Cyanomargarita calcarea GSE-NOS-MK-12-04C]|jgi:hypothetical protein|uniref:Uncharacterized protein n=1 Tax=Cyanomargarita calcarea GSE-NOS-MK-12-04C TaxID=2839659 RepID=A0A951USC2_9CYAN|nr:hypothetical protein [Cyanomargarita calcarea GSE-NOS-MK-12-04C]